MTMFVSRTACQGSHVSAFPGQYITLLSAESTTQNIAEVTATGSEITCPYSAFSDDDGNFEIEILEEDGLTSKKAKVGVLAFKTDVFDRTDESIFRISTDASTPISSPYAVIVVLEHHDSAVASAKPVDHLRRWVLRHLRRLRLQVRQLSSLKPMKTITPSYLRKNLLTMHDRDRNIRMYLW